MKYKRDNLVSGAVPLASAISVITIRGRKIHSLAWALSITMRENLEVVEHLSLVITKLDHYQGHMQRL